MPKTNCWEFMQCGREPGGQLVDELGVCPAAVDSRFDGMNQGENGGRSCWAISGTLCHGRVQEKFATKQCDCERCDFYQFVKNSQGNKFLDTRKIRHQYMMGDIEGHMGKNFRKHLHMWRKSSQPISCESKL